MAEIRGGDLVTADSVVAEGVVPVSIVLVKPKTRWAIAGQYRIGTDQYHHATLSAAFQATLPYTSRDKQAEPHLYVGPPNSGFSGYFKLDGTGVKKTPVNKWPYVIDFKLATAIFAHMVSAEYRPHEYQIGQQASFSHRPLDPHDDQSNLSNSTALNQFRMMAGQTWSRIRTMEVFSGDYKRLLPRTQQMIDLLCFECGYGSFMRKAVHKMHHASFQTRHNLGDTPSIVRSATDDFWRPGLNMTSAGGNASVSSRWRTNITLFRQARDHYDDNDLGNLQPRELSDRPVYVDPRLWPPSPVQY